MLGLPCQLVKTAYKIPICFGDGGGLPLLPPLAVYFPLQNSGRCSRVNAFFITSELVIITPRKTRIFTAAKWNLVCFYLVSLHLVSLNSVFLYSVYLYLLYLYLVYVYLLYLYPVRLYLACLHLVCFYPGILLCLHLVCFNSVFLYPVCLYLLCMYPVCIL